MAAAVVEFNSAFLPKVYRGSDNVYNLRVSKDVGESCMRDASAFTQVLAMLLECWGQAWETMLNEHAQKTADAGKISSQFNFAEANEIIDTLQNLKPRCSGSEDAVDDQPPAYSLHDSSAIHIYSPRAESNKICNNFVVACNDSEVEKIIESVIVDIDKLLKKVQAPHKLFVEALKRAMSDIKDAESNGHLLKVQHISDHAAFEEALREHQGPTAPNSSGHKFRRFRMSNNSNVTAGDHIEDAESWEGKSLPRGAAHEYEDFTFVNSKGNAGNYYGK